MYVNRHAIQCILGVWIVRESSHLQTRISVIREHEIPKYKSEI